MGRPWRFYWPKEKISNRLHSKCIALWLVNRKLINHSNKPVDILTVNEGFIKDGVPVEYV